ncbi:MAG TPA: ABC transporter ATP-binding protein [Selenomonadales bacterium]|nr:ABC transporter ATP-binding protein [Selenomonadales bacterium]
MPDTVIKVENLSKHYRLGVIGTGTLSRDLQSWWARFRGKEDPNTKLGQWDAAQMGDDNSFWALKDVSFDVKQGEVVGIIGRNGAGKSTLLKILSRVTGPTTGSVKIKGRVASLLEVGTGFHPELTGRENVYLNGTILGMRKQEIDRKFDEIVDFAEIEKFIDTPVKRYSSGMYVRLAFAVAAHLDPEILIVDEVLAVGDADFQKKCLGKMGDVSQAGRTVLFVSHNMGAVRKLCKRAILLLHGKLKTLGETEKIIADYYALNSSEDSKGKRLDCPITFLDWKLGHGSSVTEHSIESRSECVFDFRVLSRETYKNVRVGLIIQGETGELVVSATSLDDNGKPMIIEPGIYTLSFRLKLPIRSGNYSLRVLMKDGFQKICEWECAPDLVVLPNCKTHMSQNYQGILNEKIDFLWRKVD